jgi:cysteine synthase
LGTPNLWIKDETRNPSASNKDRATALVIETGCAAGGTVDRSWHHDRSRHHRSRW